MAPCTANLADGRQANRDLMEHSIKLGDCLGKGAFGSVYRVRLGPFCLEAAANHGFTGAESGYRTDVGGKTDPFIQYTQIRSQSYHGIVLLGEMLMADGD